MATARAPTTSSSQLAGRNEVMDDDDELDAVPFAESYKTKTKIRFCLANRKYLLNFILSVLE